MMMDKDLLSENGLFWLAENDENELWGTLRVNEFNEARLETFGSLISDRAEGRHRIIGRIRGGFEYVTLIDCFPINTQFSGMQWDGEDWSHQTCLVNKVVEGMGFEASEEINCEQTIVGISTLPKWVAPQIVEITYPEEWTRWSGVTVSKNERADETTRVRFEGIETEIKIRFNPKESWGTHGSLRSYSIEDHCTLILERADGSNMSFDEALSVTGSMQDLLSICCIETSKITSVSLMHEKDDFRILKAYVPMRGHKTESKERNSAPALSFNDIGRMNGVAKWLETSEEYGLPVRLLTSNWYNDGAYNEDKLSRMFTAVEGLLSRKKSRPRAKMKAEELANFVEDAVPGFQSVTDREAEEWAEKVKEIRDQRVSHSDPSSSLMPDGRTMHIMTNVLYTAGTAFLLKEMGMEQNQIAKYIQQCRLNMLLSELQ